MGQATSGRDVDGRKRGASVGRERVEDSSTRSLVASKRVLVLLGRVMTVGVMTAALAVARAVDASAETLLAQENPYVLPSDDGGSTSLFAPLEGLPVWAQAALASAVVALVFFALIEVGRVMWERWLQRSRGGRHHE